MAGIESNIESGVERAIRMRRVWRSRNKWYRAMAYQNKAAARHQ